jgi:hypothetical protein
VLKNHSCQTQGKGGAEEGSQMDSSEGGTQEKVPPGQPRAMVSTQLYCPSLCGISNFPEQLHPDSIRAFPSLFTRNCVPSARDKPRGWRTQGTVQPGVRKAAPLSLADMAEVQG